MSFTSVALQMVTVSLPILLGWCISKLGFMKAEFEREMVTSTVAGGAAVLGAFVGAGR